MTYRGPHVTGDAEHVHDIPDDVGVPAIEIHSLTKRFGQRVAVDEVDLTVPQATAFGFLGPNGAGKTTLIRTLLGLIHATSGTVHLLGRPIPGQRAVALRRVGAIVEEPRFHLHLTGRENLKIVAAAREREAEARIAPALARVGLAARADERVASYSMGMRQRLGIARCLLADPLLLILDEPMNGLDPAGMEEFRQMIETLVEEGRTVFLSSHLVDEVEKTCERIAIIDQGRILMQGLISEVSWSGPLRMHVRCDPVDQAGRLVGDHPGVSTATGGNGVLLLVLDAPSGPEADRITADVVRRLVGGGVAVFAVEPERISLEERFLAMTSRLEATP
jgi:ABC-2 type transport system ATP-binding protein